MEERIIIDAATEIEDQEMEENVSGTNEEKEDVQMMEGEKRGRKEEGEDENQLTKTPRLGEQLEKESEHSFCDTEIASESESVNKNPEEDVFHDIDWARAQPVHDYEEVNKIRIKDKKYSLKKIERATREIQKLRRLFREKKRNKYKRYWKLYDTRTEILGKQESQLASGGKEY